MTAAGLEGLVRADDRRVPGYRAVREWLQVYEDEQGVMRANLSFFDGGCSETVRNLTMLTHCNKNPEDAANTPHDITHSCDSLRYGIMSRPQAAVKAPTEEMFMLKRDEGEELRGYLYF